MQLLQPTMISTENFQPALESQDLFLTSSFINEATTCMESLDLRTWCVPSLSHENGSSCNKEQMMKGNKNKKYIGVRQRPSGRWVAEIKDSTQKIRLWLGTYDRAEDAAMAYDSASRLLRGRNAKTNFTYSKITTSPEENFSLVRKNPKLHALLRHAILKNLAKTSTLSSNPSRNSWEDPITEYPQAESVSFTTFFNRNYVSCFSTNNGENYQDSNKTCKLTLGSSKVYSSIVVAPSFSATQ